MVKTEDLNIEYIEEVIDCIVDEVENDEGTFVAVIAKFDEAKEILKDIIICQDVNFESLQIESPAAAGYEDEFILSFWMNDGVIEIGCEKLKNEYGEYLNLYGDTVFLFDNCSSKIIPLCEDSELYFVSIEGNESCDCCECGCCDYNDEDDIYGFTVDSETDNGHSKFTYYSSSPVDKTDVCDILRKFGF